MRKRAWRERKKVWGNEQKKTASERERERERVREG